MTPVMHNLATDYGMYGLAKWQADTILAKKIPGRRGHQPARIILHIQDGRTRGSLIHWIGVSASANYMLNRDGTILKVIPEADGPWTNGDVCNPIYSEIPEFPPSHVFWDDPNPFSITIEAEGTPWEPLTQIQLGSGEWLIRDIQSRYPQLRGGIEKCERHRTINLCTRPNCPGAFDTNDWYLAMAKRLGTSVIEPAPTTLYGSPILFDWLTDTDELRKGIDREIVSSTGKVTKVYALRRWWITERQTHRYRTASTSGQLSNRVGPDLYPGQGFWGEFIFETEKAWWILTEYGTRILMSRMKPPYFGVIASADKR